ncbi:MAG: flagellar motor switch protein FliN [Opitutaceae bacterium]
METSIESNPMKLIMDVKVRLTVQLGSCSLAMKDVIGLAPGTVIQLGQQASDPVGLYVNDKLIAHGEVVVVDENFGIKITALAGSEK